MSIKLEVQVREHEKRIGVLERHVNTLIDELRLAREELGRGRARVSAPPRNAAKAKPAILRDVERAGDRGATV